MLTSLRDRSNEKFGVIYSHDVTAHAPPASSCPPSTSFRRARRRKLKFLHDSAKATARSTENYDLKLKTNDRAKYMDSNRFVMTSTELPKPLRSSLFALFIFSKVFPNFIFIYGRMYGRLRDRITSYSIGNCCAAIKTLYDFSAIWNLTEQFCLPKWCWNGWTKHPQALHVKPFKSKPEKMYRQYHLPLGSDSLLNPPVFVQRIYNYLVDM